MTLFAARHFIPLRMTYSMLSLAADRMNAISPYRAQSSDVAETWYIQTRHVYTTASRLHFPFPDQILLTSQISYFRGHRLPSAEALSLCLNSRSHIALQRPDDP